MANYAPERTGFELAWTVLGIRYRVFPSFFLFAALIAYLIVGGLKPIPILIDVACIFAVYVLMELVQGLVYRSYGLRSTVIIREFVGGIYPEAEPPTAIQRIVAALAYSASAFMLFAAVFYSNQEYHWSATSPNAAFAYRILYLVTLFSGVIGLLPVYPYPGGKVMMEVLCVIMPRSGLLLTVIISIALGLAYVAYVAAYYTNQMQAIVLMEGVPLPPSIIVAVFFLLSVLQNWQMMTYLLAQRRGSQAYVDDDRAPWER